MRIHNTVQKNPSHAQALDHLCNTTNDHLQNPTNDCLHNATNEDSYKCTTNQIFGQFHDW